MIDFETFSKIRLLFDQKQLKVSQIAAELGLHEATVAKWVKIPKYRPRPTPKRPSKLDPFKGLIVAWLQQHSYTAQQLFQQLCQKGYPGGYSILKDFVRQVRPVRQPAYLTLHFAPGKCAQVRNPNPSLDRSAFPTHRLRHYPPPPARSHLGPEIVAG